MTKKKNNFTIRVIHYECSECHQIFREFDDTCFIVTCPFCSSEMVKELT